MSLSKKIQEKEKDRQKLLSELLTFKKMLLGSFCQIYVKCGKKNCHCQKGELHPHRRMSWKEGGRAISRAVPKEQHEWIEEMTSRYRKFRELRRKLKTLEQEINDLLDEHEVKIVVQTRKEKPYLKV